MSDEKAMGQVIQIDEARIRDHLGDENLKSTPRSRPGGTGASKASTRISIWTGL